MAFNGQPASPDFDSHSWVANQLASAGQGFFDGATFGLGDRAVAGIGALMDVAQGKALGDAFQARMEYERARDRFYEENFGTARTLGEVGSAFVPIPGTGLVSLGVKAIGRTGQFAKAGKVIAQVMKDGKRIKQAAPLIARERLAVSGAGATAGGASQLYTDASNGHLSSAGDLAGAILGGGLQSQLGLRFNPKISGAVGGAVTSGLQDLFAGRAFSPVHAMEAASGGWVGGTIGNIVGRLKFYRHVDPKGRVVIHTNKDKERMGEQAARIRTASRGDSTISDLKRALHLDGGGYTIPDLLTKKLQYIEAKAGVAARLTKRQIQAFAELGAKYRVDHLLPKDMGSFVGFIGSQIGSHLPSYFQQDDRSQHGKR